MIHVSIAGGSGYSGGELLRLLLAHPEVTVRQVTSERLAGRFVHNAHPNLRGRTALKFSTAAELQPCDVLFLCLPHGSAVQRIDALRSLAPRLVDLSADFRLKQASDYVTWYGWEHPRPDLLGQFVYGIPELHRDALREARLVAGAGCNATACILALRPLWRRGLVERAVIEVKAGSSEGGNAASEASHHPERSGAVRSYKPTGHRHVAEMIQELGSRDIHVSATSIEMVRGILATCQLFLTQALEEKDVWRLLREDYGDEPFIRIVKERSGIYRYPEPKILTGTNYCDLGFERDPHGPRLVVMSAIDNLMKGAAGQAVQAFNVMHGFAETTALEFPGLHPICGSASVCRMLCAQGAEAFSIQPHLDALAAIARDSREYQGHGWGCAWLEGGAWRLYHDIRPIWEDRRDRFGATTRLVAHARSAYRDEGIVVENNMPFTDGRHVFAFNGELRGVRIKEQGRIGAEKVFNYIRRLDRGDTLAALRKAAIVLERRARYVRAMNVMLASAERCYLVCRFSEAPEYFQLRERRHGRLHVVCSEPYPGETRWVPIPDRTVAAW